MSVEASAKPAADRRDAKAVLADIIKELAAETPSNAHSIEIYANGAAASDVWNRANQLHQLSLIGVMASDSAMCVKEPHAAFQALFEVMAQLADEVRGRIDIVSDAADRAIR